MLSVNVLTMYVYQLLFLSRVSLVKIKKYVLLSFPGFRWAYREMHVCVAKRGVLVRKQSGVCQFETSDVWHVVSTRLGLLAHGRSVMLQGIVNG